MSESKARDYYSKEPKQPEFRTYHVGDQKINFVEQGSDTSRMVLFVHGSPGSWSAFSDYFKDERLSDYRIISVDRPGFGYSDFGWAEPSLQKQAEYLKPILEMNGNTQKPVLVGHSLGGPVIAKMAMEYPELTGSLIYLASSVDPELEPSNWYRYILKFPLINYLIPTSFRVSNDEILPLKGELEKMLPDWKTIKSPSVVIHGVKDDLVPVGNADFIAKKSVKSDVELIKLENTNHFIPWSHKELITRKILEQLNN
ncbi:MAG: alpha/beta hydrolase [Bacteroidota bacterium]